MEFKKGDNVKFILNFLAQNPGSTRVQVLNALKTWRGKEKGWMAAEYFNPEPAPGRHFFGRLYQEWKKNPASWKFELEDTSCYNTESLVNHFQTLQKRCYVDRYWTKVGKGWHLTPAGQKKLNEMGEIQL